MRIFTFFVFLTLPFFLFSQADDLFFSEYMEGTSNNKYLEIFNGTGVEVDLSEYTIWRISNGGNWLIDDGNDDEITLSGIISNGDVYIICNSQANTDIQAESDLIGTSATFYNGNDAVGLFKNGVLIDALGEPGDGTTFWDVAGVSEGMHEYTLVRKSTVFSGNVNWAASAGTNSDDSEWIVLPQDDISNIGFHQFDGGSTDLPPVITNISRSAKVPAADEDLIITASVTDDSALVSARLLFNINEDDDSGIDMTNTSGDEYSATIPASNYTDGDRIVYFIRATDNKAQIRESAPTKIFAGNTAIADLKQLNEDGSLFFSDYYAKTIGISTVNSGTFSSFDLQVYMQDETAGINVFADNGGSKEFILGNEYQITGQIIQYNGLIEIVPDDVDLDIKDNGAATLPAPIEIPIAALLSDPENFEGLLIKIANVDTVAGGDPWPDSSLNANLIISDDGGSSQITMRIDRDTDIDSTASPALPIDVTGIFNQFDSSLPYTDGYQIIPRSLADISEVSAIEKPLSGLTPKEFKLRAAYPNPFNPKTTLRFDLPVNESKNKIELTITNVLGQNVATLFSGKLNPGQYAYTWDASLVSSGIYFAVLESGSTQKITRLLLLK